MDNLINLKMLAHPLNWITLFLWVLVLGYVINLYHPRLQGAYPSNGSK